MGAQPFADISAFWTESLANELLRFFYGRLKCPDTAAELTHDTYLGLQQSISRLVKNPLIFPLTHGCRDFFVLKSVMTSSFKRFAPVSRAFYSPEAVCGRFSGVLHPRWAHSTPVSA
ncbi:hypothetical protein [Methylomonas sp. DH-1]|uniref:hypothetical protein n=1 Tax=Methylomonas sp. (strain DH-1) TaxID=1727196 RepID=UPI0018D28A12|nr:hypothetical protein [Methylomonas sp. DH-1]